MLKVFTTFGAWLEAVPGPTEHWATILSAWAWPIAALVIVYWLRRPLGQIANTLAARFQKDDVEIAGWLKLSAERTLSTLDTEAAAENPNDGERKDARIIEGLLEYAGESGANALKLLGWIANHGGPISDPEEFLTGADFAEKRELAYQELVEGKFNG